MVLFVAAAAIAGFACYILRGQEAVTASARDAVSQIGDLLAELVFGMLIAACIGVLVPREKIGRWLGAKSGLRGILIATALGMITPGGPYASFPLVLGLAKAGADIGSLIAFLTAWAATSISRLVVWEIPLMGFDFGILRFLLSLPMPFVAGVIARNIIRNDPMRKGEHG
jgi:uncharacterized membrane protein YraQ (UPF0718 family)